MLHLKYGDEAINGNSTISIGLLISDLNLNVYNCYIPLFKHKLL